MSSRQWIKIHCSAWLTGSMSESSLNVRGAWITLLTICGQGNYGDIGVIAHTHNLGISDNDIARILGISVRQWYRYRDIFVKADMLTINPNNVIIINNYAKYQSRYKSDLLMTNMSPLKSKSKSKSKSKIKNKQIGKPVIVDNFKKQGNKGLTAFKDSIPTKLKPEQEPDIEPF